MGEFPERIWAIEKGHPSRYRVSCSVLEHGPDEATEYVRADLYAALEAQLAERVRVKPLVWREVRTTGGGGWWYAQDPLGGLSYLATSEEDKTAKEECHRRRVLSALEATPPAPKVTEAMVRMTVSETIRAMGENPDEQIIGELTVFDAVAAKVRAALTAAQEAGKP